MIHRFFNSTLRELQVFLRSFPFWATFCLAVMIFAVSGPYGTSERMTLATRFGYWLTVHAVTWTIAIVLSIVADVLLDGWVTKRLARMMLGSLAAALPIGAALGAIDAAFANDWSEMDSALTRALLALPLCAMFCLLTYLVMQKQIAVADMPRGPHGPPYAASVQPDILTRLKPQNRGGLVRLSVQDHYTEVVTTRGRELLLLRFADALKEIGETPGLQVHRSHWIADVHVEKLRRDNGRLLVVMKDGAEIPVSRPNLEIVRTRFAGN